MPESTYALFAAMYGLDSEAAIEFPIVITWQDQGNNVAGATILRRAPDGEVSLQQPGGGTLAYCTGIGVATGLALSYWVAVPFLPAVVGGVIGYWYGRRRRERETRILGRELAGFVPRGASAIVAVVEQSMIPTLNRELGLALRTMALSLEEEPVLLRLAQALVRGNTEIAEALAERATVISERRRDLPDLNG